MHLCCCFSLFLLLLQFCSLHCCQVHKKCVCRHNFTHCVMDCCTIDSPIKQMELITKRSKFGYINKFVFCVWKMVISNDLNSLIIFPSVIRLNVSVHIGHIWGNADFVVATYQYSAIPSFLLVEALQKQCGSFLPTLSCSQQDQDT